MTFRAAVPPVRRFTSGALLALALVLSGCSNTEQGGGTETSTPPPQPEQALPLLETNVVASAPEMFRAQPYASLGLDLLPAVPERPYAFAASTAAPLAGARPGVWLSDNGLDWSSVDVDPNYQGSFSGGLVGGAEVSAVVGTSFEERTLVSRVWRSTDRRAWAPVELPDDFALTYRVATGTVTADRVIVAGTAANKDAAVAIIDPDRVEYVKLPDITAPEQRSLLAMAANGDSVVLVARVGPEGERGATVSYASSDGGVSWDSAETVIDEPQAFVAGVTWTGDRFVATGAAVSETGTGVVPSAWSSVDGADWAREEVPRPPLDSVFFIAEGVDVWLAKPTARDGWVHVVSGNLDSPRSGFYERSPEGVWTFTGVSGVNAFPGTDGVALPVNDNDRAAVLSAFGTGLVTVGVAPREGDWREVARIGALEETSRVEALFNDVDRSLVQTERVRFRTEDGNFTGIPESKMYELRGEPVLQEVLWEPPEIGALTGTVVASDGTSTVLLGSVFNPETSTAQGRGWFRAAADAPWVPVQGVEGGGDVTFHRVLKGAQRWVAVGEATSGEPDAPWRAEVWTSADGITWQAVGAGFTDPGLASGALDVCPVPGEGTSNGVMVVGFTTNEDDRRVPAVWRSGADGWQRVEADIFNSGEGTITRCASDEEVAVLAASTGGRGIVIRTEDGADFEGVFRTDFGSLLSNPVAVPGGFAAAGRFASEEASGPAVWLSADGRNWTARAVPSVTDGATLLVLPHGQDLVVTMGSDLGEPVQLVRGIAEVIAGL